MVSLFLLRKQIHYEVCTGASSNSAKPQNSKFMGKRYKNLFSEIVDIDNLRLAYEKTVKGGNRYSIGHLAFKENKEANLFILQQQLTRGDYSHGEYAAFKVFEPKERIIHSLPFRDRVVQHAINNIIEPIFDNVFYSATYACRKNKGTHKGVKDVQAAIRRSSKNGDVYYLKMDFRKYFYSINKAVLFKEIERKISDKKLMLLLRHFAGNKEIGIPIGSLLSQLFANIYGHIFDRFIKTRIKTKNYFRYMDDTVILSNNKKQLRMIQRKLALFSLFYMKLKFSKWQINGLSIPLDFLGYRISKNYKLIRKDSVTRAKRKIKFYQKTGQTEALKLFLASWSGHIKTADSRNLVNFFNKEVCHYDFQCK